MDDEVSSLQNFKKDVAKNVNRAESAILTRSKPPLQDYADPVVEESPAKIAAAKDGVTPEESTFSEYSPPQFLYV